MELTRKYNGEQVEALLSTVFNSTLQEKTVTVNDTSEITPDDGYLGLKKVTVEVATEGSGSGVSEDDIIQFYDGTYYKCIINVTEKEALHEYPNRAVDITFLADNEIKIHTDMSRGGYLNYIGNKNIYISFESNYDTNYKSYGILITLE